MPFLKDSHPFQVTYGDRLSKLSKQGNWFKIQLSDGREGFIYGKAVETIN